MSSHNSQNDRDREIGSALEGLFSMSVPANFGGGRDDSPRPSSSPENTPEKTRPEIGFANPYLTRMTLPYRKVETNQIVVKNGNQTLYVTATGSGGLPYGKYPRLVLLWLTEQVVSNYAKYSDADPRQKEINLGSSLRSFMKEVGISISGRSASQLIEQIKRLSHTTFLIEETGHSDGKSYHKQASALVSEKLELYWSGKDSATSESTTSMLDSSIQLSSAFFELLRERYFPYDKRILRHVQASPMAIDIYLWLTQHGYANKKFLSLRWDDVMAQFGTSYNGHEITPSDRRDFRRKFDKALNKVREVYPEIRVISEASKLTIMPFNASVDPLEIENKD